MRLGAWSKEICFGGTKQKATFRLPSTELTQLCGMNIISYSARQSSMQCVSFLWDILPPLQKAYNVLN